MAVRDQIRLVDLGLAERLFAMSDEEIAELVFENIEFYEQSDRTATSFNYALGHGQDHLRTVIKRFLENDRDSVIYGLIKDLAYFEDKVFPDLMARSFLFDDPSSAQAKHSSDFIPIPCVGSEAEYYADLFYVLEPLHLDRLADKMESGLRALPANTNHDIFLLRRMSKACESNVSVKPIYIYELSHSRSDD